MDAMKLHQRAHLIYSLDETGLKTDLQFSWSEAVVMLLVRIFRK
jgi:hypothetical protein